MSKAFQFKKFTIEQDQCAMKVGTDGVLLGAWANCSQAKNIFDIGTGTGLIALMLAQRNPQAIVEGVEIDENAWRQARKNANDSPWSKMVRFYHADLGSFKPSHSYDLIISNPPYFKGTTRTDNDKRTTARHAEKLKADTIIAFCTEYLNREGKLCIILPADDISELFIKKARDSGLYLQQVVKIHPTEKKQCKRLLMEFGKELPRKLRREKLIIEKKRHVYSKAFYDMVKDFYLAPVYA